MRLSEPTTHDAIIIGAGQAGGPLAVALARAGRSVALIERGHVGGTCVNAGCTPTKTMIASGRVAHLVRRSADYGIDVGEITVDMRRIRRRKRDIVERFRVGSRRRLENVDGLDLFFGEGRFVGSKTVDVALAAAGRQTLTAERVFINTGLRPRIPDLEGLDAVPHLDSTSIMELDEVPAHLLVIGGGYIGVEFSQLFRRLGSVVTIVQRGGQLLRHEDADIAGEVARILREDGIEVRLDARAVRVEESASGTLALTVHGPTGDTTVVGSHLLVAVGRTPNTERLQLDVAGVETDERGFVVVDEYLETSVPGVFALGDVHGGPAFTHIAYDDFRIVKANLLGTCCASTRDRLVPYTVYMDPQLGGIGLTEREAVAEGREVRIAKMTMDHVGRALETDEARGVMKVLVDADTERILGACILGIEGGEIMSLIQTAMIGGLSYKTLRDMTFAHPSIAESMNTLFGGI